MKKFLLLILFSNISLLSAQADWSRLNVCEYKNFDNDYLIEQLIKAMTIEDKVGSPEPQLRRLRNIPKKTIFLSITT